MTLCGRRLVAFLAVAGLVVGFLAGCASPDMTGSPAARLRAWSGAADLHGTESTLTDDVQRIDRARRSGNLLALKTECAVFVADVRTAIGFLPTPDSVMTGLLNDAYNSFAQAATDCYDGASSSNRQELERAYGGLSNGSRYLDDAKARARALGSP